MRYLTYLLFFIFSTINVFSQTGKVEGKITDSKTGKPLTGASVTVAGNSKGIATDIDGMFVIAIPASKAQVIKVSSVGYQTKEIANVASGA